MLRILTVMEYYLPSYRAGGPVRSLANMVSQLKDDFQFLIITRDRDLGDNVPFSTVSVGKWQAVSGAQVLYLSPNQFRLFAWRRVLQSIDYDLLYLNSFFSPTTVQTLFLLRTRSIENRPVVLAPRGQFSPGALGLKPKKKSFYIKISRILGLCEKVLWQASSSYEADDIRKAMAPSFKRQLPNILIAPNLSPGVIQTDQIPHWKPKRSGAVRIAFVSRITRKKNLNYALKFLSEIEFLVL